LTRTRPDLIRVKKIKPIPDPFIFISCQVESGSDRVELTRRIESIINTPSPIKSLYSFESQRKIEKKCN
jgi:hypothetical protein